MSEQIPILFLSRDLGLAEPLFRALGAEFLPRATDELEIDRMCGLREWDGVVLLDMRVTGIPHMAASVADMRAGGVPNVRAAGFRGEESDQSSRRESSHREKQDVNGDIRGTAEQALRLVEEFVKTLSSPPVVALCDEGDRQIQRDAVERGAYDTVTNPPNMMELRLVLRRAYRARATEREVERLKASVRGSGRLHELLGTAPAMQELFGLAQKIAPCDVNVLITGETGTGKELLARAIHQMSGRAAKPLVAFSCANLPETLVEDELFGHEKGAFTGAMTMRRGRIEAADQSTLFLDEIGDLALGLQPKLLRVLQERSFERLGSNNTVNVNIRVICATNRSLDEMVQQGKFREDLYYRLNVVQLHLPALRERRDDIPLLAQHFLEISAEQFRKKARRFSQAALHALEEYAWPGNVRELQNAVQRAVVLSEGPAVEVWQLPAVIRGGGSETPQVTRSYEEEVRDFKRRLLLRTLRDCGWRKAESARVLGVARGYLHRLINQLGIQEEDGEPELVMAAAAGALPSAGRSRAEAQKVW